MRPMLIRASNRRLAHAHLGLLQSREDVPTERVWSPLPADVAYDPNRAAPFSFWTAPVDL